MITDEEKLRMLTQELPPGPWTAGTFGVDRHEEWEVRDANGFWVAECGDDKNSAEFIAAARTVMPELLIEIELLRKVYDAAKTWCETVYIGKPHPKYPAYPGDELHLAVNGIRLRYPSYPGEAK